MDELTDNLPCGVLVLDDVGAIVRINATAEQQLGYTSEQLVGKSIRTILTIASRLFYQTHAHPLIQLSNRADEIALTLLTQSGERIPVLLNAIRKTDSSSRLTYCAYFSLAQRHQFEEELILARKAAEQAQQDVQQSEAMYRLLAAELEQRVAARTAELSIANNTLSYLNTDLKRSNENLQQFAYIASHDLQEPLRKIQSFSDLLLTRADEGLGIEEEHLRRIQTSASRMSTLIKDLLAFSRISTQQEDTQRVELEAIVAGVLTDLEVSIQETQAHITVVSLPAVMGNASQLGQLFQNLIGNALKFCRRDAHKRQIAPQIQISTQLIAAACLPATVYPTRPAMAYHRIDVADNGIGFDEKYTNQIFQVFQRLHNRNEFDGTGIGLAICHRVTANHGGAITASSKPNEGATFHVYLPAMAPMT